MRKEERDKHLQNIREERKDGCGLFKSPEELGGKLRKFVPESHN